ncbi:RNA-binding protein 41-like isoform X1 [Sitophilus oryzae]|uniref:RNA-binding protein 41-like isoform X1 n=1 Tax=Sitophilus oryzae TaxID=7048 RepID=A0A6J2XH07_SITOR|nr:RNA-binding protein 41-like isoform X1 [Sitophilus oryzae]
MYSIFNGKAKKHDYLGEGEPPPKKIVTEGTILIKNLAKKQLKTNATLTEQLLQKKEFVSSEKYTDITSHISGKSNLTDFKTSINNVDTWNLFKSKNISDRDIEMYKEYISHNNKFWEKHKHINKDVLVKQLKCIEDLLETTDNVNDRPLPTLSRHQQQYLNSLKPNSIETKLLKFATENIQNTQKLVSNGPMDELSNMEKQITESIQQYTHLDYKKIRKKARSLGNKIISLEDDIKNIGNCDNSTKLKDKLPNNSLWDIKEKPTIPNTKIIEKSKTYSCKPETLYTIKNDQIIKLDDTELKKNSQNNSCKSKLSIEEIRNIQKFSDYETGIPSRMLFLKNLSKNVKDTDFDSLLENIHTSYTIKIMKGKMRGQAFIEFVDEGESSKALNILNGVILEGKPVIVQFGKRKSKT